MSEETLFSFEETGTRQDVAASLRALVAELSGTGPVTLVAGGETVTLHPSDSLAFEVEVERRSEGDESQVELEVELEWEGGTLGADERQTTDAPQTTDSADSPGGADAEGEAASGTVVDLETPAAPTDGNAAPEVVSSQATFEVFRDTASEWRWRLVHRNGDIIATSGEGYTRRRDAENGLRSVVGNAPGADVVEDL